jgi:hypothetical protein
VFQFGPKKGKEFVYPAKVILKFRVAKEAKDVVLRKGKVAPDVSTMDLNVDEEPRGQDGEE